MNMVLQTTGKKSGGAISMKFREMSDDMARFDASDEDKRALLAFIETSVDDLKTDVIGIGIHSNVRKEEFGEMHSIISGQLGNDQPVEMPRVLFGKMGIVAGTWKRYGFEHVFPENHEVLKVDKDTVYAVHDMFYKGFGLET
jgi:hypothetical protein